MDVTRREDNMSETKNKLIVVVDVLCVFVGEWLLLFSISLSLILSCNNWKCQKLKLLIV